MTRSQSRTSNSVSLFPFLAVLVCAMGALIFLLLVTTRRIRQNAVLAAFSVVSEDPDRAQASAPDTRDHPSGGARRGTDDAPDPFRFSAVEAPLPPRAEPKPPDPNVRLRELIAALSQRRDDRRRNVQQKHARLATARQRLDESESKFGRLKQHLAQTKDESLASSVNRQVMLAEFSKLNEQIDEANRRLIRIRQQNADRDSKYAIIPFDGQSGTTRRPIFIECTKDGLKFLEEEIMLTAADLDGFTPTYNPVLAGTRALVRYRSEKARTGGDDQADPPPYVLLVVRPSGSIAYYAARRMLAELGQPIGYELLQADRELDVPPADSQAAELCQRAIARALAERQQVIDEVTKSGPGNGYGSGSGFGDGKLLRFRRGPDGLEPVEEEGSWDDRAGKPHFGQRDDGRDSVLNGLPGGNPQPRKAGSAAFRQAQRGPGGLRPEDAAAGGIGVDAGDGTNDWVRGGPGDGTNDRVRFGTGSGTNDRVGGGSGRDFGSPRNSVGFPDFGPAASAATAAGDPRGTRQDVAGLDGRPASGMDNRGVGTGPRRVDSNDPNGGRPNRGRDFNNGKGDFNHVGGDFNNGTRGSSGGPSGGGGSGRSRFTDSPAGRGGATGSQSSSGFQSGQRAAAAAGQTASASRSGRHSDFRGQTSSAGQSASGGQTSSAGQSSSASPSGRNGASSGQNSTGGQTSTGGQLSANGTTSAGGPASSGGAGQAGGSGNSAGGNDQPPLTFRTFGQQSPAFSGGSANPRRAWGIGTTRNGIGFERETVIYVTPDYIRVGNQPAIELKTIRTFDRLPERVLNDLDRHAYSWGKPPVNFYWVPAVRFLVGPGGNHYYERLQAPLRRWGISSTVEYPRQMPVFPERQE